jgi:hypothetical protein
MIDAKHENIVQNSPKLPGAKSVLAANSPHGTFWSWRESTLWRACITVTAALLLSFPARSQSLESGGSDNLSVPILNLPHITDLNGSSKQTGFRSGDKKSSTVFFSESSTPPSVVTSSTSPQRLFRGDISHVLLPMQRVISGEKTAGQPNHGYEINPELSSLVSDFYTNSGYNSSESHSGPGRTGQFQFDLWAHQYGQGDVTNYGCFGFNGSKPLSTITSFFAGPEIGCMGGQITLSQDFQWAEWGLGDADLVDHGKDVGAFGIVLNDKRTNRNGLKGTMHVFERFQSIGTKAVDAMHSDAGPTLIGSDQTSTTYPDQTVGRIALVSGGSGYTVGCQLTVAGGTTVDTPTRIAVVSVRNGAITPLGFELAQNGAYVSGPPNGTVTPTSDRSPTPCSGTGAKFTVTYEGHAGQAWTADTRFYANAINMRGLNGSFPNNVALGTEWWDYDPTNGWEFYIAGHRVVGATKSSLSLPATATPTSSSSTCSAGTMQWDTNYIYICTSPGKWKRAALSSF